MHERVAARVAGVFPLSRVLVPTQLLLNRQESDHTGRALPGIALGVAQQRLPRTQRRGGHQAARQLGHLVPHRNLPAFFRLRRTDPPHHPPRGFFHVVGRQPGQLAKRTQPGVDCQEYEVAKALLGRPIDGLLVCLAYRIQPRLGLGFLEALQRIRQPMCVLGIVERRQNNGKHVAVGRRGTPGLMAAKPRRDVRLLELADRKSPAESAEIIKERNGIIAMALAKRAGGDSPLTILNVLRTDPSYLQGLSWRRRFILSVAPGDPLPRQRAIGGLAVTLATNPIALLVEQRHPLPGAGPCVVPAVGLGPVPSRAVRLSSLST